MFRSALTFIVGFAIVAPFALAQATAPAGAMEKLPVKEITVFKDGHCLVLHSGSMKTDADGAVTLDDLPAPVLGTFWPYSADDKVRLSSTVSSESRVKIERTALSLRELIEANVGADVVVTEASPPTAPGQPIQPLQTISYTAKIEAFPSRSIDEIARTDNTRDDPRAMVQGDVVVLKTDNGSKVVNLSRIQDITFRGDHQTTIAHEEYRNRLKLQLVWPDGKKQANADVGMMYVQKGIRWIPGYRVTIDGKGQATVELQATLLNELIDLEDVTANLVIGVPSFDFKDSIDPIALQQTIAELSPYFNADARSRYGLSNAMVTQASRMGERQQMQFAGAGPGGVPEGAAQAQRPMDLGPEIGGSSKNEDLFLFTVNHITLKRGARMVVPVTKYSISYKDVYTLDNPFAPPPEVRRGFNADQQTQLSKLLASPKVMHKLRLNNASDYPLTTAPAMIVSNGHVVSQGMMTYAPRGSSCDLGLTAAVDVKVKKTDAEKGRVLNAEQWMGDAYGRIDLEGTISLTNYSGKPVTIEVVRQVLGQATSASADGKIESVNLAEDLDTPWATDLPQWWYWYGWPYWWNHFNGIGRVTWNIKLDPEQKTDLKYEWAYYWR
jgi:hypothetical protein